MTGARRRALAVLPLLLAGCSSEFDNPFANTARTVVPRASADIIFAGNQHASPGTPRELFAVDDDGANPTQLTFCSTTTRPCDTAEVSSAPDRQRVAVRRRLDTNGNSRLEAADGDAMLFVDLARGTEAALIAATASVSSIDWAPTGDVLVYAATGEGGVEDLWRVDPNGQNNRNLTVTTGVRERGPRVDPTGSIAVYERIDPSAKSAIFVFVDRLRQVRVTTPGEGSEVLPGTPYVVGSDADPDFSPEADAIVFRRLTGTGVGGLGTWDVMTVRPDGTGLAVIAAGEAYRGAPDWGTGGIVFEEADAATGARRIVVVQRDGSGRRVVLTAAAGTDLTLPRWLP
jgi:dipeptidyl aminopeptidase/acylaminoacyl peptidase